MQESHKQERAQNLSEVYELLGLQPSESGKLYKAFIAEDQKLFKQSLGAWDYKNPELLINQVKDIVEKADSSTLNEIERENRAWILWLWNHHAISVAIHLYKDKAAALEFVNRALEYQPAKSENKITNLFKLLLEDKYDEAVAWADKIIGQEAQTARIVLKDYPGWFK